MRNNSYLGDSGFTPAFYIFFWIDLGSFIVRSVNESFASGELSSTFKQGVKLASPKVIKIHFFRKNGDPYPY